MRILNPRFDLETYFADVARAPQRVLLLDYDGTLAPFHARPERAVPYPGVAGLLSQIMRSRASRVVIVSGRTIEDLRRVLGFLRGAEAWGTHGWQHRAADGARTDFEPGAEVRERLERAAAALAAAARPRRAPRAQGRGARAALARAARRPPRSRRSRAPASCGPTWRATRSSCSISTAASSCARAAATRETWCARCWPRGAGAAAYLGDDVTDEDAFAAMRGQGLGALVSPQLRATRADLWLAPPRGLLEFLRALARRDDRAGALSARAARGRSRLIVVSNRLPVALKRAGRRWQVEPGSGGLVTALLPVLRDRGGTWIGWAGAPGPAREFARRARRRGPPGRLPARRRAAGRSARSSDFYLGFSNEVIWPLFHDLPSLCNFEPCATGRPTAGSTASTRRPSPRARAPATSSGCTTIT